MNALIIVLGLALMVAVAYVVGILVYKILVIVVSILDAYSEK